jgi:hypothetical protein
MVADYKESIFAPAFARHVLAPFYLKFPAIDKPVGKSKISV